MGTRDSLQLVGVVELFGNVLTEGVSRTSWRDAPTAALIGVRPKQVAHWALLRHFLDPIELFNLVERVN